MGEEWTVVVNRKNRNREEKLRWKSFLSLYPHVVSPQRATSLEAKLRVKNLKFNLLSEEWVEYQKEGWEYVKIIKSQFIDELDLYENNERYSCLDLDNGWGDVVLFRRI